MVGKRGKCPSLISGTCANPIFDIAKAKRTCKRCRGKILKETQCVVVPNPRTGGRPSYCFACIREIIEQTQSDLNTISRNLKG